MAHATSAVDERLVSWNGGGGCGRGDGRAGRKSTGTREEATSGRPGQRCLWGRV